MAENDLGRVHDDGDPVRPPSATGFLGPLAVSAGPSNTAETRARRAPARERAACDGNKSPPAPSARPSVLRWGWDMEDMNMRLRTGTAKRKTETGWACSVVMTSGLIASGPNSPMTRGVMTLRANAELAHVSEVSPRAERPKKRPCGLMGSVSNSAVSWRRL